MKEESKELEVTEENILVLDAGITSLDGITRCCWGAFGIFMS